MGYFLRFLLILAWLLGLGLTSAVMVSAGFYAYTSPQLPDVETLRNTALQTPLRIYTSDNKLVGEFGEIRRDPVALDALPDELIQAFLSAEDSRFFDHGGIDLLGLTRASIELLTTGRIQSGGSTITMQVAKNFFLSNEQTFTRKFNEILLALKIENELSKNEILELYLNKIFLGNRAYGVQAAARIYYGKDVRDLSLAQMAMIAGLPKAPSRYNPIVAPERAKLRRNWILSRMRELGVIDEASYEAAVNDKLTASRLHSDVTIPMPYVAELGRQDAIDRFGKDAYENGVNVHVTVDSGLQMAAEAAVKKGLLNYTLRHGYHGPWKQLPAATRDQPIGAELEDEEVPEIAKRLQNLDPQIDSRLQVQALLELQSVYRDFYLIPAWVSRINSKGLGEATLLLADGSNTTLGFEDVYWARAYKGPDSMGKLPMQVSDVLSMGDLIYISPRAAVTLPSAAEAQRVPKADKGGYVLSQVPAAQGALVAMDPKSGAIRALVGGYDFHINKFNRAWQARRQAGSNIKPFIYLAALESGETAASIINDAPVVFDDPKLEDAWRPVNSSGKFYGPTRLRKALYLSRNLVSVRLLERMGVMPTIRFIASLGFNPSSMPKDLSLALGSADFTPVEMAAGYALLANGGRLVKPHIVTQIEDASDNVMFKQPVTEQATAPEPVVDPRSVFIIDSILADVITRGTGRDAQVLKRGDLRGKTGTTNDQVDAWFSGYNQDLVTSVWIGFDQPQTLGRQEYGGRAALPIWIDFMREALESAPESVMQQPEGLVKVWIDADTAEPAMAESPNAIEEFFKEENAPIGVASPENVEGSEDGSLPTEPDDYVPPEMIF
ncbi:penicillin-binding protein 1A [Allohahella sp. A8]|uniref:penicillin-binding protein 1A n=1 Tax=Allohahella sp. A8 TaxID=3141461 RepID=UPI000C0A7AE8|nr:peptidase [Hahellaceae bacterium]|tara:strand:+ start:33864 stop:36377 length:2514 start_codon:yes stop_codon:yes gene_type:complete